MLKSSTKTTMISQDVVIHWCYKCLTVYGFTYMDFNIGRIILL